MNTPSPRGGDTDTSGASATRRRTASDQVSAALVSAAETVLDRGGVNEVTVRAVAREAGVAPMGVYNRFGSKEGLISALAMRARHELTTAIAVPADCEPAERLRRACRGYRSFALAHPARYTLIFATGSPLGDTASAVATHGRSVFGVLTDLVAALVADDEDPRESSQAVWSGVHGAVTIEQAGLGQTADATASFERLLDLLVAGLTAGVAR
ncbi:TetR/AcrR family transcriptional regulator [Mycolicibacterium goodii]|uniref:HTH tetR-type domain-containing protein n=1 Tax=Mycolicibacterium goodii TaxID=134601 RepID=A0A0K0XEC9_MYCGD|nr:hypothetical protein AFA91_31750 [Mycolicibacterium goodii]